MADRSVPLFAAIYAKLAADTAVIAIVGTDTRFSPAVTKVYTDVPAGAVPPYVALGEETANDFGSSLHDDSQEHTVTIHCWSEKPSRLEVKQLVAAVREALHNASLTLSAGRCVYIRCESKDTFPDPDGVSHHGVLKFRALTRD